VASDGEVIRRSVEEPAAFEEIFERHSGSVWRYVRGRVGQTFAEDIVADTFLIAFQRRDIFDPSYDSARPWLLGIANNLIRHRLRDERVRLAAIGKVSDPPAVDESDDVSRLDAERMRPLLIDALLSLAPHDRETFLLVALGELTYAEAAVALDIPVGTVRSRMHRIRVLLRERVPALPAIDDGGE
jgi:RNA polymerase sigma factor (sigma-70 family)